MNGRTPPHAAIAAVVRTLILPRLVEDDFPYDALATALEDGALEQWTALENDSYALHTAFFARLDDDGKALYRAYERKDERRQVYANGYIALAILATLFGRDDTPIA
ncbi:MAG TPA: hypothetical protein VIU62_10910 [Chloroflexota bacterium]